MACSFRTKAGYNGERLERVTLNSIRRLSKDSGVSKSSVQEATIFFLCNKTNLILCTFSRKQTVWREYGFVTDCETVCSDEVDRVTVCSTDKEWFILTTT